MGYNGTSSLVRFDVLIIKYFLLLKNDLAFCNVGDEDVNSEFVGLAPGKNGEVHSKLKL
jgi:hypothetical protein